MTTVLQSSDITHLVYVFLILVAQSPKDYTSDHPIYSDNVHGIDTVSQMALEIQVKYITDLCEAFYEAI